MEPPWAALQVSPSEPHQVTEVICIGGTRRSIQQLRYDLSGLNWIAATGSAGLVLGLHYLKGLFQPETILRFWVTNILQCETRQVLHSFVTISKVIELSCFSITIFSGSQHFPSAITRHKTGVHSSLSHWTLPPFWRWHNIPTVAGKKVGLLLKKAQRCSWLTCFISPVCLTSQF